MSLRAVAIVLALALTASLSVTAVPLKVSRVRAAAAARTTTTTFASKAGAGAGVGLHEEDGNVLFSGDNYFYPRPTRVGYGDPTTARAGELHLDGLCKAIVNMVAETAVDVQDAMAGVAITTAGQIVVALSGVPGTPSRVYDDNAVAALAVEFRKVDTLRSLLPGFSATDIINLNAPNQPLANLNVLFQALGTSMGVPAKTHPNTLTCPVLTRHVHFGTYAGGLPANTLVWKDRNSAAAGDFLSRVYTAPNYHFKSGYKFGACAGSKLAAFGELAGLTYRCMAERKTTAPDGQHRASCLTCQHVIPELRTRGTLDAAITRWYGYAQAVCPGIGADTLDAAQHDVTVAEPLYTAGVQAVALAQAAYDTAEQQVTSFTPQPIPGGTPHKALAKRRTTRDTKQRELRERKDALPALEDALRRAQMRVQLLTTGTGAAICRAWGTRRGFALW